MRCFMIFYHIDRTCKLTAQSEISFVKKDFSKPYGSIFDNLSKHGFQYFSSDESLNYSKEYEIILEYVRAVKFPHLPSRFTCLFASKDRETALKWACNNSINNAIFNLVTVEADVFYAFDYTWFTPQLETQIVIPACCAKNSIGSICELANNYWSGAKTNTPLIEILIPLPCKIIKSELYITNRSYKPLTIA